MNICCIGAGYVGGPTMAVMADHCPDVRITVVDANPERIAAWNSNQLPIYEPGLEEVVRRTRGKNLFFSDDSDRHIAAADVVFVCVNTPTKTFGQGAGRAADVQFMERAARQILRCSTDDKIVVEKSTVPVRSAEAMERIFRASDRGVHLEVVSNPEFLAEGTAIADLEAPDRVLIGSHDTDRGRQAVERIASLYGRWVPEERIITTRLWSSELSKLVANAFLAQRVSSINAVSALCEETGADVDEVARAIGMDTRIGSRFLKAGVGFGGSCFKKDLLNLSYLAEYHGLPEVAHYWYQVVSMNDFQQQRFVRRMVAAMFNTVSGKRIVLLGAAFKAHTSDTRESPALEVCRGLLEERADITLVDPKALENAKKDLGGAAEGVRFENDPYQAAEGAEAIAVLTGWPEFVALDYKRLYDVMTKPAFLFDGRNLLDHKRLHAIGFEVYPVGKPPLSHF